MRRAWVILLAVGLTPMVSLRAEDDDGPGRGVARLSLISGDVSVRRGDSGDWVAAAVNAPLVVQDRVLTGVGSRAEVQFDWANMIRLSANTEVSLTELEHRRYQVGLARGTVMLRVLRDIDAEIEVNTPSVSVRPVRKGSYRITVTDSGSSEITVRSGETEIYTPTGVERLRSGRTMLVRGAPSDPEFRTVDAVARDSFDGWNEERDRYLERSRSYRYVSRDIYGADELDYYGRWVWVAPYGWVWTPWGVASWWAPYRHGRWVWVDWYGWTWLSYDPWGWAPFHYGRWFWHGPYGWCWYPGPLYHRHYWRPALVAFFGFHVGGLHIGVGFGRVGWVPLAPYEPFYPWYGPRYYDWYRRPTYIDHSVRIVNNVQIVNIYRNARVVNAVSGADIEGFARGGRIHSVRLGEGEFHRASLVQGALPVVPATESLRFADRQVRAVGALPRTETERFFARRPAAPVERIPFEDQRRGMEQIVRRTFAPAAEAAPGSLRAAGEEGRTREAGSPAIASGMTQAGSGNLPRSASDVRVWRAETEPANPSRGAGDMRVWRAERETGNLARGADERGWRRVGEPARSEASGGAAGGASGVTGSGWRRLGEPTSSEAGNLPRLGGDARSGGEWRRFSASSPDTVAPAAPSADPGWRRLGEADRRPNESTGPGLWRRFGESPRESGATSPATEGTGWRRFGEPVRRESAPVIRGVPETSGATGGSIRRVPIEPERSEGGIRRQWDDNWRRFSAPPAQHGESGADRAMPRWGGMEPRSEPRQAEPRRGEPIFINPPIVRERAAPRFEGWGRMGGESRGAEIRGGGVIRGGGEPRGGEVRGGGASRSGGGRAGGPR